MEVMYVNTSYIVPAGRQINPMLPRVGEYLRRACFKRGDTHIYTIRYSFLASDLLLGTLGIPVVPLL